MRHTKYKKNISERGQMLVIFALAAIGLFAMVAFAIDGSMVLADRRHAQNAADTAVMAGALKYVRECEATGCDSAAEISSAKAAMEAAALDRADSNGYPSDSTRSEVDVHTCDEADASCAAPYAGDDNYIQLIISSHVDTFFAPVIGVRELTNKVQAVAMAIPGSETSCLPCVDSNIGGCSGFALLALNGGTMTINSSTSIQGDVGYSAGVTSGTNQKITTFNGTAYIHSTANVTLTSATYQPSGGVIQGGSADTKLNQANTDAAAAAAYFAGLPSNGSLGNVTGNLNLSTAGDVTVFDVANWSFNSKTLTLNGSGVVVFRVTGSFDWADSQTILNGPVPANVVFYFPNASTIKLYKATNVFAGTILAPTGSVEYHNPATFDGRIIAKNINVHSDFNIAKPICPICVNDKIGGVDLSGIIDKELFFFANGSVDANWQGATKGFVGNAVVNGIIAKERTSGGVAYAGTISTNDSTLSAWQNIVNQNPSQASASLNQTTLVTNQRAKLIAAFQKINAMPVSTAVSTTSGTRNFDGVSAVSLNGVDTTGFGCQTIVVNVTSGFQVTSQINITGDACDIFILRWDTDGTFTNGYQGQVKYQSGGAIVPLGGLKASNFIHVAGDINASGGGSTPTANGFPQGPRLNGGTGSLIVGGSDFSGGGFFTGYWLTTGKPTNLDTASGLYYGNTASLSNAIFVGGWYSLTDKFSMTSGTSGVYVSPTNGSGSASPGYISLVK